MSLRETPMIRWYWSQVGGLLLEEFKVVAQSSTQGRRLVDGLIVLGEPTRLAPSGATFDLRDKNVVVIQAKNQRLGMSLMGQTLFSAQLVKRFEPRSIQSIALCSASDAVLQPLLETYAGCKVVVCPAEVCCS